MQDRVLAGRYQLLTKLGEGGMGSVWRAEHLTLHTKVAIKLMEPSIAESSEALARFQREAQSAAELRSTHIVQIFDYGVDEGTPYIAMELLEGESLSARLERLGKLTPSETVEIVTHVARALARAHEKGIAHRDLKPDNIFIIREGDTEITKVLDFGIAKKLSALSASSGIKTHTGALLGTPYYMSPEQALGQTKLDHCTDIWSLGIIAYECLTGARPFEKDTLGALLVAICHDQLPLPSRVAAVPKGFDEWFARAAAREVTARFQSAMQAATELRTVAQGAIVAPTRGRDSSAELSPTARGTESHEFVETAGPASVTIPGGPTKTSRRRLAFLVFPALALAGAAGFVALRHLSSGATQPVTSTEPVVSSRPSMVMASETTPNPVASASPVVLAVASVTAPASATTTRKDAGPPIMLIGSTQPPAKALVPVTPKKSAVAPVKTPNATGHASAKPSTAEAAPSAKPNTTTRANKNAAGF